VASLLNSSVTTPSEAQANLAAAASVLQSSKIGKIKPDSSQLKAISDKLVEDQNQYPELPQVWETTGVFINYKSEALLPASLKPASMAYGMDCGNGGMNIKNGVATFTNCEVSLDHLINGAISINFIHCIVHYHGGPISPAPMTFYGSIFRFDVIGLPPPRGIHVLRELAATESIGNVTISG
jgi:hypothetical protein